jgi:hypothetical protein
VSLGDSQAEDNGNSYFSGSLVEVTAGQAAVVVSQSFLIKKPEGLNKQDSTITRVSQAMVKTHQITQVSQDLPNHNFNT